MLNLELAIAALNPASTLSTISIKIGALAFRAWLWIMFFHDPSPSAGLSARMSLAISMQRFRS